MKSIFESSVEGESYSKIQLEKPAASVPPSLALALKNKVFGSGASPAQVAPNPKWFQLDGIVEAFTNGILSFNNGIESYQIQSNLEQ